jgi:hypothetical protein
MATGKVSDVVPDARRKRVMSWLKDQIAREIKRSSTKKKGEAKRR